MMKINYFYEVLLSERNTCLRNLITLHPKNNVTFPQICPVHIQALQKTI